MPRALGGRVPFATAIAPRLSSQARRHAAAPEVAVGTWTFMGGTNGVEPAGVVVFFHFPFNWAPMTRRVVGGYVYFGNSWSNLYRWDVANNTIDEMTGNVDTSSAGDYILAVNGTELVLIGVGAGTVGPNANITIPYDIASDTWGAARTPYPVASGPYAPSFCQDDNFVYVISGEGFVNPDAGGDELTPWKYELATDTWSQIADLTTGFWSAGADVATDGKVYCIGGQQDYLTPSSYKGVVRVYDPNTDTWDESRGDPPVPTGMDPAVGSLEFPVVAALPDGKLLYGGGIPYSGGPPPDDNAEFWIYAPDTDTFTPTAASDTADPTLLDLGGLITATDGNTVYCADSAWDVYGRFDYGA